MKLAPDCEILSVDPFQTVAAETQHEGRYSLAALFVTLMIKLS